MKLKHFLTSLLIALSIPAALPLDNEGLIKLKGAGFDDETILLKMDTEPAEYDLSTDGLIALKEAGISDAIIKKALQLDTGVSDSGSGSTSQTSTPAYTPPSPSGGSSGAFADQEFPSIAPPEIQPELGGKYFTRITFWYERGKHQSTNYSRGTLVPINTEVELVQYKNKLFQIRRLDTNETIDIVNIPEYTGETVQSLPTRYLADQPTPVDSLPDEMEKSIAMGQLRLGMTKELAILARGYPPIHETPSLSSDRWVYWSSRFVKQTVVFRDDRLIEGRGIY